MPMGGVSGVVDDDLKSDKVVMSPVWTQGQHWIDVNFQSSNETNLGWLFHTEIYFTVRSPFHQHYTDVTWAS